MKKSRDKNNEINNYSDGDDDYDDNDEEGDHSEIDKKEMKEIYLQGSKVWHIFETALLNMKNDIVAEVTEIRKGLLGLYWLKRRHNSTVPYLI